MNIGKPRLFAAGVLFLAAATASYLAIGTSAKAVEPAPVIWGYGYITVDSIWADLATDMSGTWVAVGTKGKLAPLAVTALEVGQFTTALDKLVNAK